MQLRVDGDRAGDDRDIRLHVSRGREGALKGQEQEKSRLPGGKGGVKALEDILYPTQVLDKLQQQGISVRVASPKLVMEEAPESYKNVTDVVDTCQMAGISKKTMKLRPIAVIKG